jgi:dienelactone hydrolase
MQTPRPDPKEMMERLTPLLARSGAHAGHRVRGTRCAALRARTDPDRIAVLGYGTGGAIGLELGRDGADLRAIVTVNAMTTGRPGEAARIRCPV